LTYTPAFYSEITLLAVTYSINGAIPVLGNAYFFRVLGFNAIYQRDNDYGNDKAAPRLINPKLRLEG